MNTKSGYVDESSSQRAVIPGPRGIRINRQMGPILQRYDGWTYNAPLQNEVGSNFVRLVIIKEEGVSVPHRGLMRPLYPKTKKEEKNSTNIHTGTQKCIF